MRADEAQRLIGDAIFELDTIRRGSWAYAPRLRRAHELLTEAARPDPECDALEILRRFEEELTPEEMHRRAEKRPFPIPDPSAAAAPQELRWSTYEPKRSYNQRGVYSGGAFGQGKRR